jgi:HEAT repeat protein
LVEHYAVAGLGRIGSPDAIAALKAAQNNPDEDVRSAVRSVLRSIQAQSSPRTID